MIRKKWRDGEVVLSVETEDEFGKALATGEAVEMTRELADQLGMMEDDTISGPGCSGESGQTGSAPKGIKSRLRASIQTFQTDRAIDPASITATSGER